MLDVPKPTQSREALESIAKVKGVTDEVYLVGIRGFFRDSLGEPGKNDRGVYDDAIWLVTPKHIWSFNANADPSVKRPGIAVLKAGVHPYKKGIHGLSKPAHKQYRALRPATAGEKLPVRRDGSAGDSFGVAINIHRGSYTSTSSEGCQTIYPSQWNQFIQLAYKAMDDTKQQVIKYVLVEKPDLR